MGKNEPRYVTKRGKDDLFYEVIDVYASMRLSIMCLCYREEAAEKIAAALNWAEDK